MSVPGTLRIDLQQALLACEQRLMGPLGLLLALDGSDTWGLLPSGGLLLVCWSGELLPLPSLDIRSDERAAGIVGFAPDGQTAIETWAGITFADGVHHFAVLPISPAGVPGDILPHEIVTRVKNSGSWLGWLPATPSAMAVQRLPGNLPRLTWWYSQTGEVAACDHFDIYETTPGVPFNFESAAATVAFVDGQTRYEWTGAALSVGDVRHYTVRAVTAGGVKSLIPRLDAPPSSDYASVPLERSPRLEIWQGPPSDAGDLFLEPSLARF